MALRCIVLNGLLGMGAVMAAAQQPSSSPDPVPPTTSEAASEPDVSITATVRWRSLRFDVVGTPRVELRGAEGPGTVWEADRVNLPRPVEAGRTYGPGEVRLRIFVTLAELLDASLKEASADKVRTPAPERRP